MLPSQHPQPYHSLKRGAAMGWYSPEKLALAMEKLPFTSELAISLYGVNVVSPIKLLPGKEYGFIRHVKFKGWQVSIAADNKDDATHTFLHEMAHLAYMHKGSGGNGFTTSAEELVKKDIYLHAQRINLEQAQALIDTEHMIDQAASNAFEQDPTSITALVYNILAHDGFYKTLYDEDVWQAQMHSLLQKPRYEQARLL